MPSAGEGPGSRLPIRGPACARPERGSGGGKEVTVYTRCQNQRQSRRERGCRKARVKTSKQKPQTQHSTCIRAALRHVPRRSPCEIAPPTHGFALVVYPYREGNTNNDGQASKERIRAAGAKGGV